jgi:hypothetical protein
MMKKFMGWIPAVLALLALNLHAQLDEEVFKATMKEVDSGGIYLNYVNQTGIGQNLNRAIDGVMQSGILQGTSDDQNAQILSAVKLALRLISLESYKAQATSGVTEKAQAGDSMYFYKSFLYTGSEPQGLAFDLVPRRNQPFAMLKDIPYNTRLAVGGHITPDAAWQKIALELSREPNPQFKNFPAFFEALFEQQTQVKLSELLKSIEGEYTILITSSGTPNEPVFRLMAAVTDKDGMLGKLLKAKLPPNFQRAGDSVIQFPPLPDAPGWIEPKLLIENGKITLVSHPDVLAEIKTAETTGLLKSSADFAKGIPQEGLGYLYLDINQSIIDILAAVSGEDTIKQLLTIITPPRLYAVTSKLDNGYLTRFRSNYSVMQLQTLPWAIWTIAILSNASDFTGLVQNSDNRFQEYENRYHSSQGFVVGKYIQENFPNQKVLVLFETDYEINPRTRIFIDGLKAGGGAELNIKADTLRLNTSQTEQELGLPLFERMTAADFDKILASHKDCGVVISCLGLPRDHAKLNYWNDNAAPKLILVNSFDLRNHDKLLNDGKISALVAVGPDARFTEDAPPKAPQDAFNTRYILIDKKNTGNYKALFR